MSADTGSAAPGGVTGAGGTAQDVVARFNLAWGQHDIAGAMALISEDCVFESTSPAPDGQRSVGKAAVRTAWQPIFDDASSQFTVEEFFTAGPRVVQRWRYDWDGGHVRGVDVMTVAGGLITAKLSYVKG
jgi:ketosteroid isomerase-like protein